MPNEGCDKKEYHKVLGIENLNCPIKKRSIVRVVTIIKEQPRDPRRPNVSTFLIKL